MIEDEYDGNMCNEAGNEEKFSHYIAIMVLLIIIIIFIIFYVHALRYIHRDIENLISIDRHKSMVETY
jgi:uncharacterized membrane protein